jgi:hypothetical protein
VVVTETARRILDQLSKAWHLSRSFHRQGIQRGRGYRPPIATQSELSPRSRVAGRRGIITESLEVAASASQVNYDSPEIAHVVGSEQLETSSNHSHIDNLSFGGGVLLATTA